MTIKAYALDKAPRFTALKSVPIHLGKMNGHHYYAFPEEMKAPKGGKIVKKEELLKILSQSPLIKQIKAIAAERILNVAPLWKQQNAVSDLIRFQNKDNLSENEKIRLTKAAALLQSIDDIREKSNEIETLICAGNLVDLNIEQTWINQDA